MTAQSNNSNDFPSLFLVWLDHHYQIRFYSNSKAGITRLMGVLKSRLQSEAKHYDIPGLFYRRSDEPELYIGNHRLTESAAEVG